MVFRILQIDIVWFELDKKVIIVADVSLAKNIDLSPVKATNCVILFEPVRCVQIGIRPRSDLVDCGDEGHRIDLLLARCSWQARRLK